MANQICSDLDLFRARKESTTIEETAEKSGLKVSSVRVRLGELRKKLAPQGIIVEMFPRKSAANEPIDVAAFNAVVEEFQAAQEVEAPEVELEDAE